MVAGWPGIVLLAAPLLATASCSRSSGHGGCDPTAVVPEAVASGADAVAGAGPDAAGPGTPSPGLPAIVGAGRPTEFRLDNRSGGPLFLDMSRAPFKLWRLAEGRQVEVRLETDCRVPHRRGEPCLAPGADFECGSPPLRTLVLPRGAASTYRWDGIVRPSSAECSGYHDYYVEQPAEPGRYRVEFRGAVASSPAVEVPAAAEVIVTAKPSGPTIRATAEFAHPSPDPVALVFEQAAPSGPMDGD
ncbi:MAG: hypothetical protein HY907_02885 [Deltaproteobacteria bacterium]|nr:hypothetical protein [Deltaproteobacteria bacterium]